MSNDAEISITQPERSIALLAASHFIILDRVCSGVSPEPRRADPRPAELDTSVAPCSAARIPPVLATLGRHLGQICQGAQGEESGVDVLSASEW
jgi:hypothetical protein